MYLAPFESTQPKGIVDMASPRAKTSSCSVLVSATMSERGFFAPATTSAAAGSSSPGAPPPISDAKSLSASTARGHVLDMKCLSRLPMPTLPSVTSLKATPPRTQPGMRQYT